MRLVPSVEAAEEVARELLEPLGNRWAHVRGGDACSGLTAAVKTVGDRPLLIVSA
jgi:hypothetical protein